jgi:hypothetical protein
MLHLALTGSPPRSQIWSFGISPPTNNAALSAESGLDQKSAFRNARFWRKADILRRSIQAPIGDRILRNCLGTAKKTCREYRRVALWQICLSNGLATLPAKKRRAAEFLP